MGQHHMYGVRTPQPFAHQVRVGVGCLVPGQGAFGCSGVVPGRGAYAPTQRPDSGTCVAAGRGVVR